MIRPLLLILSLCCLISINGIGQLNLIKQSDQKKLQEKQDTLIKLSFQLNKDSMQVTRMKADSQFTRVLVRTLQIPHSFQFPFDSLLGISKLYAPDSSFRIFSWNLSYDDYYHRQRGTIQIRTKDGSLKMYPLRDVSEFVDNPIDSVRDRMNWIGAYYYNMIRTQHAGKNYYTLFGFDPNGPMSSVKWIDVLHFNPKGEPVFGGPFFSYEEDSIPQKTQYRFQIEFKKDAQVLVNYIKNLDMILVDHLISENNDPDNKWTYIPDGDQEGFVWKKGKWVHIDKVFTLKLKEGEAPREVPILDQKSNQKIGNQ
ncbi:MAG: hypothetical protein ACK5G0_09560 [Bacteroidota bacterium]